MIYCIGVFSIIAIVLSIKNTIALKKIKINQNEILKVVQLKSKK